ncbi:BN159_2729 family protein [Streptomyces californicus]|uniref:BN159_2729 family protein n=1 Tax=Streptomyces californicus TaxID=67351 RepID=A0ABX7J3L8_9ACTN|nr:MULTISPECIES: BN159_2729 family protein [Streptomyces]QRV28766.1 BN159_2729 family protein [Streptomyces californicus]QRV42180.1 BN159_2729 family protein [Streptomyces californicus]
MNGNLPQAITMIRELLAGDGDVASAIGHALDGAGLLVDPERAFGAVLRRTPQGWPPVSPATQAAPPEPTELEQEASDWDAACERAAQLVHVVRATYAAEPDFVGVRADRDTVVISLQIAELSRWAGWMSTLGIVEHQLTGLDYVVCGRTTIGDVPVSVLAYDLPEVQLIAQAKARRPYRHAGLIYDLAVGHKDITGDTWYFHGDYSAEGMPLLSKDGRPERCSLAGVVDMLGPILPVREPVTAAQGGERG